MIHMFTLTYAMCYDVLLGLLTTMYLSQLAGSATNPVLHNNASVSMHECKLCLQATLYQRMVRYGRIASGYT